MKAITPRTPTTSSRRALQRGDRARLRHGRRAGAARRQELGELLEENGAEVDYAIHPVAGRMPGHMNVLLAEANVPYDQLVEMDDDQPAHRATVDVAIVIGANDVVNPAAREDPRQPDLRHADHQRRQGAHVFVLKRSMASGFAGIDNPLFFKENTRMLFGDAKESISQLIRQFK